MNAMLRVVFGLTLLQACAPLVSAQSSPALEDAPSILAENAKIFSLYEKLPTIDTLLLQAPSASTGVAVIHAAGGHHNKWDLADKSPERYLITAAYNAGIIVIAEPVNRNCAFTEGETFVFCDYTVVVDRVVSQKGVTLLPGQKIVVARPGGTLSYHGRPIDASIPDFPTFRYNHPYALFLNLLDNGSFAVFGEWAFDVSGPTVVTEWSYGKAVASVPTITFFGDLTNALNRVHAGEQK